MSSSPMWRTGFLPEGKNTLFQAAAIPVFTTRTDRGSQTAFAPLPLSVLHV